MVWSGSGRGGSDGRSSDGRSSEGADISATAIGGAILTARGTQDGLVLRADGSVTKEALWDALRGFIQSRRSFVEGNQVIIEWAGETPSEETVSYVRANVLRDFDIELITSGLVRSGAEELSEGRKYSQQLSSQLSSPNRSQDSSTSNFSAGSSSPNLFGGIEAALDSRIELTDSSGGRGGEGGSGFSRSSGAKLGATSKVGWGSAVANWDDADARVVYGTLRSGQKVETEHSILVFGDVNSGAEIVAGGDVVVLGNLRGVAHAGAYDETGGGRVIFALHLEPTQLRIGAVISRGMGGGSTPEIAQVDGQGIVVEPYQAKGAPSGRKAA